MRGFVYKQPLCSSSQSLASFPSLLALCKPPPPPLSPYKLTPLKTRPAAPSPSRFPPHRPLLCPDGVQGELYEEYLANVRRQGRGARLRCKAAAAQIGEKKGGARLRLPLPARPHARSTPGRAEREEEDDADGVSFLWGIEA